MDGPDHGVGTLEPHHDPCFNSGSRGVRHGEHDGGECVALFDFLCDGFLGALAVAFSPPTPSAFHSYLCASLLAGCA